MPHSADSCPREVAHPFDPTAANFVSPADRVTSSGHVDGLGTPAQPVDVGVHACLCRLSLLAPNVANELCESWSDLNQVTRQLEQLLGGEREVPLTNEAIIEMVRIYGALEDFRAAGRLSANFESLANPAQPRC